MRQTTVGQLMLDAVLPAPMRGREFVLDKKGVADMLQEVAQNHPEEYRRVTKDLADLGRDAAFTTGGTSFGLRALRPSVAIRKVRMELQQKLRKIYADPQLSDKRRDEEVIKTVGAYQKQLVEDVFEEAKANGNPLARQLLGAGRGNKYFLNSLLGADLLYTDHRGHPIPIPVLSNYAQGMRPVEYFAGAFGARKGVIDLKAATQDAGFFAKQLVQAAHRLLVTANDDEDAYDEANPRGLPVDTSDPDNEGALLAHPVGGYPRNTELTPKILRELRHSGHDTVLVRSPTVGGPVDGGVYARDVGRREKGRVAPIGDYVGVAAAQALAEPVTQAQISSKHTGGIAGAAGAAAISGFKWINQLVQVPKTFQGGAAHAQRDGRVGQVRKAPQGGHYITVDGEDHYVAHGHDPKVKVGDVVEAGDVLSDGMPNPAEIVKHKGIGEGRRYFTKAFRDILLQSGVSGHRRNIELISRGLINHVRLNDELGDWSPDDVLPYQVLERSWRPRDGAVIVPPKQAVGRYLERPVLHYTIGTKIRPSMVQEMSKFGVGSVYAHHEPPPFESEMVRGMANASQEMDWFPRALGSYQKDSLLEGARRGSVSDEAGASYVPALARGVDFGHTGLSAGWRPTETSKPGAAGL